MHAWDPESLSASKPVGTTRHFLLLLYVLTSHSRRIQTWGQGSDKGAYRQQFASEIWKSLVVNYEYSVYKSAWR
jgi:hypothetical protein